MGTYEEIVTFVFRCINLGIFISLAVYLFKKKAKPLILDKINKKKEEEEALRVRHNSLQAQLKDIESKIEQQEKDRKILNEKIKTWEKNFYKSKRDAEQKREIINKTIEENVKRRQEFLAESQLKNQVLPCAFGRAEKKLSGEFEAHSCQDKLLRRIFKFFEKSV